MFLVPRSYPEKETGAMKPSTCYAHACTVADVAVDDETGEVVVIAVKNVFEIGRALNPKMVEQQLVGGSWMGIGHALYETTEPYYPNRDHGAVDFNEYLMPGPGDLAETEIIVIERPSSDGPYGAKGPGEMCANPQIPAVANAIFDAVGVRIDTLPITPERILRALKERGSPTSS
jgi:CO/xanthine dehydrogenase Mo-binding subunit